MVRIRAFWRFPDEHEPFGQWAGILALSLYVVPYRMMIGYLPKFYDLLWQVALSSTMVELRCNLHPSNGYLRRRSMTRVFSSYSSLTDLGTVASSSHE